MQRRMTIAFFVLIALVFTPPSAGAAAASASSPDTGSQGATGWYLALGDSLAAGFQPGQGEDRDGGYVGGALASLQQANPKSKLANLSCSGATSTTLIQGGDACTYEEGSQLAQALVFLKAHRGKTSLVTLDIGANDVAGCVHGTTADFPCIFEGLGRVGQNVPSIVSQLRAAAGPETQIIVLNYYNPFLAAWLLGPDGQTLAQSSTVLLNLLNGAIAAGAAAGSADIADVAAAFDSDNFTLVSAPPFGIIPTNVAHICQWTWMCVRGDIHPNDIGYAVLAATVSARLN